MVAEMEIGVTGTQKGTTAAQLAKAEIWFTRFLNRGADWQNNGDCIGSDAQLGALWKRLGGKLRLHIPAIDTKRAFLAGDETENPLPYLDRNKAIVARSRALLATPARFTEERRSGTWSTIRHARRRGIPVIAIYPDGSEEKWNWPNPATPPASS